MSMNVGVGMPMMPGMMPGMMGMPGFGVGGSINVAAGGPPQQRLPGPAAPIPDPSAVQRQKETYAKSLEDQLRKGVEILAATHKQQTDQLHAQANQEKHRYNIALDQQVKQRELELSQQYNEQLMRLQQAAQMQRAELEQQACGMTLEYQQKKVAEEYMAQQTGIQQQHLEAQSRLGVEIEKLMGGEAARGMLERVTSNVRAGNMPPFASYALPQTGMAQAPPFLPGGGASAMRPYVPPGMAPMAPQQFRGPAVGMPGRGNLSYVPSAGMVAAPQLRSFVPAPNMIKS